MTTSSDSARKLKHKALDLFRAGRLVEARDVCLHASGMDNADAVTWCLLGTLNGTLGDLEEAIKCLHKATELQPDYAEAHANLGVTLEKCGRLTDALTSYREAIRLRPDHADAYFNAGNVLKEMGQPDEAVQHYRAALRIRPDDGEALVNLGAALSMLK